MSLADWAHHSRERIERQPLHEGVIESVLELWRGGKRLLHYRTLERLLDGEFAVQTRLAGTDAFFLCEDWEDLRRAKTGLREAEAMGWLFAGVDDETVFWDVGAFHGTYAVIAGNRGADVLAFEPHPGNRDRLETNASLNDLSIRVSPLALSDQTGTAAFSRPERNAEFGADGDGETEVPVARGDDIGAKPPDVVKIDTEGHECAVLDGMVDTLDTVNRVLVEVHLGVDDRAVRDRLERAGFDVRKLDLGRSQTYLGGRRP